MTKKNNEWTNKERAQFVKEITNGAKIQNCGKLAGAMPCQFYIQKQLEKIDKLHAEIDELKQRIWHYENL